MWRKNKFIRLALLVLPSLSTGLVLCLCNYAVADEGKDRSALMEGTASHQTPQPKEPNAKETKILAEKPKEADYVGTDTCAACHEKQAQDFKNTTHFRQFVNDKTIKGNGCESCHGAGSLHADDPDAHPMKSLKKNSAVCFTCHIDKQAEASLPYHHPVKEGIMSCMDCHDAHGHDMRPEAKSMEQGINGLCTKCHLDQKGPFVYEHQAMREGCTLCHQVHGSIQKKMLVQRDNNLCLSCHIQVNFPMIGGANHAGRLPQGACYSGGCHVAVHGSQVDFHLRY